MKPSDGLVEKSRQKAESMPANVSSFLPFLGEKSRSISDTGEGIPASDIKRIFEPFYTKKVMGRSGTGPLMALS
jgi:nitrogen fixation/metabolism regulation signal transduction histidine kinase